LSATGEIFFQILYFGTPMDPATVSRYFRAYESKVVGKLGRVRQGADTQTRPGEEVGIWEEDGVHYYADIYCRKSSVLLNIDFNGSGAMQGTAVVGVYGTDHWNVYTPTEFSYTNGTLCYELLPTDDEASTYTVFGAGTLVETLHTGTTSDHLSFSAGTLVETLHTGTSAIYTSFSVGTLVETLHTGTSAVSVGFSSGGTEPVAPFWDGGTVSSTIESGTLFVAIVFGNGAEGAAAASTVSSGSLWTA
jgi:hypothetical protein